VIEFLAEAPSPTVARELAALQERAYAAIGIRPWTAEEIEESTASPYVFLVIVRDEYGSARGFACFSIVEGEGEVLAVAVDPDFRRRGVASAMFDAMTTTHDTVIITRLVLEVAETNHEAIGFYEMLGFVDIARRRDYYRIGGNAVDAKIMERVRVD